MGNPIRIMYEGAETTVRAICELKGLHRTTFYDRFRTEDRPMVITEDFLERVRNCGQPKALTLDGEAIRYTELKAKLGTSSATISNRIKQHGRELTTAMFERGATGRKPKPQPSLFTGTRSKPGRGNLEAIPGPSKWELKNLSNAGANGFCKCPVQNSLSMGHQMGHQYPVTEVQ